MIIHLTHIFILDFIFEITILSLSIYLFIFGLRLILSKSFFNKSFLLNKEYSKKKKDKYTFLLDDKKFEEEIKKELKPRKSFLSFLSEFKSFKN